MHLPGPLRVAVGLVASAADEARHLPDRAIELPMLAVSTALQVSLRAQQRYARLAARGDQALSRRPAGDDPPAWATFDEPVPTDERQAPGATMSEQVARNAGELLDQLFGEDGGSEAPAKQAAAARKTAAAKKTAAERAGAARTGPAQNAANQAAAAKQGGPARKAVATKAAAKKSAAKKTAAKKTAPARKPATAKKTAAATKTAAAKDKTVNAPRHTAPSRFDTVEVPDDPPRSG